MRTLLVVMFCILSIAIAHALDPSLHVSIEDLILHETEEIQKAQILGSANLSLKYIERAESYIVKGNFEKALEDLEKGYEAARQLKQTNVEQRSLMNRIVAYAYLADDEKALAATQDLENSLPLLNNHNRLKGRLCKDEYYVSGPDEEPAPGWCKGTVTSTADFLDDLVKKSGLYHRTQEAISFVIGQLRASGLQCCARKERWKGCVGPLAKKTLEWQASGVPADPTWD